MNEFAVAFIILLCVVIIIVMAFVIAHRIKELNEKDYNYILCQYCSYYDKEKKLCCKDNKGTSMYSGCSKGIKKDVTSNS